MNDTAIGQDMAGRSAVRSFVRREGRMTSGQRRALQRLWGRYGFDPAGGPMDLARLFGRDAPVALEIGFGMGDSLAAMAMERPQWNFLGIEVYRPGIGSLMGRLETAGLENVRIICADAAEVLRERIPDGALAAVYLFFPDPWPKKRHHKRRLVQSALVQTTARKLAPGGRLHMATDWEDYARHALQVMAGEVCFRNLAAGGGFAPRPAERPQTKFERRGHRLGHPVRDLIFERR